MRRCYRFKRYQIALAIFNILLQISSTYSLFPRDTHRRIQHESVNSHPMPLSVMKRYSNSTGFY